MTIWMKNVAGTEHEMPAGHPEQIARLERVNAALEGPGFFALGMHHAPMAGEADIMLAHPRAYLEGIRRVAPSKGMISLDPDTSMSPATLEAALADPANWTVLDAGQNIAGLGQRPNFVQVYLLRDGDPVSLLLLPLSGQGYGGRIDAIMALRGDMNTIAGIAVTQHSETPGLGARIEESSWRASFPGTELRDASGELRFRVARGPASGVHEVDGITGATRTGRGVTQMVRFWLGPDGYGPLLDAIERGEF